MASRAWFVPLLLTLGVLASTAGTAEARRGRRSFGGSQYHANGTFGLGLELGAPSGLNAKYFLSDTTALNFGIGADGYGYGYRDGVSFYLDYLWHPVLLASTPAFQLPLYVGIGGRLWSFNDNRYNDDGLALGVRVPVGIDLDLNNVPLDFYLQLTFVLDFYQHYRDNLHGGLEGSVGFRFWF